jgi:predicted nucleotidyltransferase
MKNNRQQVRLTSDEIVILKGAVLALDPEAQIYLFGSRTDKDKKGGDIDLLVMSQKLKNIDSLKILKTIFNTLEEQKIDIIIAADDRDPFIRLALETGVKL